MANELDRRYGKRGLHTTSLHPGAINTGLARHLDESFVQQILSHEKIAKVLKSVEQGAATTVLAAVGRDWEGRGGKYLEDCREAEKGANDGDIFSSGWVKQTYDEVEESRLWKDSLDIVGMKDDL